MKEKEKEKQEITYALCFSVAHKMGYLPKEEYNENMALACDLDGKPSKAEKWRALGKKTIN